MCHWYYQRISIYLHLENREKMTKEEWNELAYKTLIQVAETYPEFKPDQIWEAGLPKPSEAHALGAIMTRGRREGIIEKTGRVGPTNQPESHNTDVTIWKSLIYIKNGDEE